MARCRHPGLRAAGIAAACALAVALASAGRQPGPDAAAFWGEAVTELDAFMPAFAVAAETGCLSFQGWRDQWWQARWWPGAAGGGYVVTMANLPGDWSPPDDGRSWVALPFVRWTERGLPDSKAYCLREQALLAARALEVIARLERRKVPVTIVAEGMACPAALGVALAMPDCVERLVFLDPRPYRHLGKGADLPGPEAEAVGVLLREHPDWRSPMQDALAPYDIAVLAPAVQVPVAVVDAAGRSPGWLDEARQVHGWRTIAVPLRPVALAGLSRAAWFSDVWAQCMGAEDQGVVPQH